MRHKMILVVLIGLLTWPLMLLSPVYAEGTPQFLIYANKSEVSVGESVIVTLNGLNIKDMYAYEARFTFDPDKLKLIEAKSSVEGYSVTPIIENNEIIIAHTQIGNIAGQNGNITIGTLTFEAKSTGTSQVKWESMKLIDSSLRDQAFLVGRNIAISVSEKSNTIPVPPQVIVTPTPTTLNSTAPAYLLIDDKMGVRFSRDAFKVKRERNKSGQQVATFSLDEQAMIQAFAFLRKKVPSSPYMFIEAEGMEDGIVQVELPAQAMADAKKIGDTVIISIQAGSVRYELPVQVLLLEALAKQMGVEIKDMKVVISFEQMAGAAAEQISGMLNKMGAIQLVKPVEFGVFVEAGQERIEVRDFDGTYINRAFLISGEVQPSLSTAVWLAPEGKLEFVPATFNTVNGSTEVIVKRRGNSIYTVIQHQKIFADVDKHWAKKEIELLASKLIIKGTTDTKYDPEAPITRAQFAALLVRSLGLEEDASAAKSFSDVSANNGHIGAIGAAVKAGLVEGFSVTEFRPTGRITREEMTVMISRALHTVGKRTISEGTWTFEAFKDSVLIQPWAQASVKEAVESGIIQGKTETTFAPREQATRAEAAVILKRMLQFLEFIN